MLVNLVFVEGERRSSVTKNLLIHTKNVFQVAVGRLFSWRNHVQKTVSFHVPSVHACLLRKPARVHSGQRATHYTTKWLSLVLLGVHLFRICCVPGAPIPECPPTCLITGFSQYLLATRLKEGHERPGCQIAGTGKCISPSWSGQALTNCHLGNLIQRTAHGRK